MSGKRKRKKIKDHKSHEMLKRTLLISVLVICVIIIALVGVAIGMYASAVKEVQSMDIKFLAYNDSSKIYYIDEDGNEQQLVELERSDGKRTWLNSEDISPYMKSAIVAIEDERFYQHKGVDIKRTGGAVIGFLKGDASYGGSTITQQLIKNVTGNRDKSVKRKVKEMLMAIALEKELTKDQILTNYLNRIALANNCTGVEAAANLYYNKSAKNLNLNEAAVIAGITQRPTYFDPIRNPNNAKNKRDTILYKMHELGMISQEDRDKTLAKDLELNINYDMKNAKVYSYFEDHVLNEVLEDLQKEAGYSEEMANQIVFGTGVKIYATIDPKIQTAMEDYYERTSNFTSVVKNNNIQSAMVVMDPYTGELKGIVGGVGEKTEARGFNRATQSSLQPGSSIKPLTVYGPALEEDLINEATILYDSEIKVKNGKEVWSPHNSYKGFKGKLSLKEAVGRSSNTTAVQVLDAVGIEKSYKYATEKFGLSTLTSADKYHAPLSLGGLNKGVTPEEMAAAYSVFANSGQYIKPHSYTKVVDHTGNVLLEKKHSPKQVIKKSTAYIMTDILYSVTHAAYGTGKSAKFSDEMPIYGKTGTTNDAKDKWFAGYTPYYVGVVWCGFDTPESLDTSTNISAKVWGEVMKVVHEGLKVKEFDVPDTVIKKKDNYFYVDSKLKQSTNTFRSDLVKPVSDDSEKNDSPSKPDEKDEPETKPSDENDNSGDNPAGEPSEDNQQNESSDSGEASPPDNDSSGSDEPSPPNDNHQDGGDTSPPKDNSSNDGGASSPPKDNSQNDVISIPSAKLPGDEM